MRKPAWYRRITSFRIPDPPAGRAASAGLRKTGLLLLLLAALPVAAGMLIQQVTTRVDPAYVPAWPSVRPEIISRLQVGKLAEVALQDDDLLPELIGEGELPAPRDASPHHSCLSKRDYVLALWSARKVTLDGNCEISEGLWALPLDGILVSRPGLLAVEPVVPLRLAAAAGLEGDDLRRWGAPGRNDAWLWLPMLLKTSRSRDGRSIEAWSPAADGSACEYARRWLAAKYRFGLLVTAVERKGLIRDLARCGTG